MNYTATNATVHGPVDRSVVPSIPWRKTLDTIQLWWRRARTRKQLAELDDQLLADIGVDWAEARREAAKPFWRA